MLISSMMWIVSCNPRNYSCGYSRSDKFIPGKEWVKITQKNEFVSWDKITKDSKKRWKKRRKN